ncbi:hypothetical protein [Streptomyces triticisoli]|nr:hypothetical protein [Streptomyces triticisoli]
MAYRPRWALPRAVTTPAAHITTITVRTMPKTMASPSFHSPVGATLVA